MPAPLSKTRHVDVPHYLQTPDLCCCVTSILILQALRHPQRNFPTPSESSRQPAHVFEGCP